MSGDPQDQNGKPDPNESEGWESVSEESKTSLATNPELEAALREASEAIDEDGYVKGSQEPEEPESPDLSLPTHQISTQEAVARILDLLRSRGALR